MNKLTEHNVKLQIVIYGAGAVGGVVGSLLSLSGTPVVLIGRPSNVKAIKEHGILLITPSGSFTFKLAAVTTPAQIEFGQHSVVFLCVKGQDTERVIHDLYAVVQDVPIFCFQNGVRNEGIVSKYYPRVYGVMVKAGVVFMHDGEVISRDDPPGHLVMGRYPKGKDELVDFVATKLRNARFKVVVTPEIMPYKWGKLVLNLTNSISAITNSDGKEVSRIAAAVQNEGKEILTQAQIRWIPIKESPPRGTKSNVPLGNIEFCTPLGSTWQSLTRRQGTVETEFLNGEIVRIAKKLGKAAPINEKLLLITSEMAANHEGPGKYTADQLIQILNLDRIPG
jgi:2-dehydropantoate 2-reductase